MFLDPNGLEVLDPAHCRELVGRNEVGRLGFVDGDGVTVLPVVYAVIDGHVLIRTASGSKMASVVAHRPAALEVDHIDERRHTGWSVLVRGEMELVSDEDEIAAIDATGLHSWGQTGSHFLRLPLTEVTGRRMPGGPRNAMR